MWVQMISARLKPGKEGELSTLTKQLQAAERPGSGLVRTTVLREQGDPSNVTFVTVFESEEKARAREADEQRQADLVPARATMAEMFDGPPSFADFTVAEEYVP